MSAHARPKRSGPVGCLKKTWEFMNMFLHHTTPGCHMAEKLFMQAPGGSADDKKSPAETQTASVWVPSFPIACCLSCAINGWQYLAAPLMSPRRSVSRLLQLSDSGSGRPHLSDPFFPSRDSPLAANRRAARHSRAALTTS